MKSWFDNTELSEREPASPAALDHSALRWDEDRFPGGTRVQLGSLLGRRLMIGKKDQVVGLDVARSVAILSVVASHYLPKFVSSHVADATSDLLGYFGVELFFALSGFLIGRIVIVMLERKTSLLNFWTRRWLRTLPAYFLVLAALIAVEMIVGHPASALWLEYPIFFQSFIRLHDAEIYGATWSLATEEWFYLSLPLVLLALTRYGGLSARRAILTTCIIGIAFCPIMRGIVSSHYGQQWWVVRKYVFSRMDALLLGVLLAAIKCYWPEQFKRIVSRRGTLALVALTGLAVVSPIFYEQSFLETLLAKTALFSIVSLCCALLVAALDSKIPLSGIAIGVATYVSVTSYSVYLVHPAVLDFSIKYIGNGIAVLLGAICATYALATLIYLYWELPMMELRDSLSVSAVSAR